MNGLMAPTDEEPLLVVQDVSVTFRLKHRRRLHAVNGVSLEIRRGETFGLIGESGSGKSTLARAVLGLVDADGAIRFDGSDLSALPRRERRNQRQRIQMVFQDPHASLDPRMRVADAIQEPAIVSKTMSATQRRERVSELLHRVGLDEAHGRRYPHELSGGQKQRVDIARALMQRPELLVCDESVSALDVALQAEILNLLADLKAEFGLTLLFISHDLGVIAHIADRVGVMYLGRIMELGDAETLMAQPLHPYTEALIAARPEAVPGDERRPRTVVLEGDVPSPIDPPSGCPFRTRCRYAVDRCSTEVPTLRELSTGQAVACHRAEELTLLGDPLARRSTKTPTALSLEANR